MICYIEIPFKTGLTIYVVTEVMVASDNASSIYRKIKTNDQPKCLSVKHG